ncbi:MAG: amidohydrolase family protein [Ilumatobacteraceae bacterium]
MNGTARREIDASGALVTPGFVDLHTHYDGQATWDDHLEPSSCHGVTTVVQGNCGVGFAPVHPGDHDRLIELMEGVEDIPGTALHEGLQFNWVSFPEYLDVLDARSRDVDLGTQVPHAAVRLFVMGERGVNREPATDDDIASMAAVTRQGIDAGALGFSTSRTVNHRSIKGELTPTLNAEAKELLGIVDALRAAGAGVIQAISDFREVDDEFAMLREVAAASGRPMSISVAQSQQRPAVAARLLELIAEANADGITMRAQVAARAIGLLFGFEATLHPFMTSPGWTAVKDLPPAERVARLRQPEVRAALIAGMRTPLERRMLVRIETLSDFARMFPLGNPPVYEPAASTSIAAIAEREHRDPADVAYDLLLADDGRGLLYMPGGNYANGNLDIVKEQLEHPFSVSGLSDGGAHVGTICDASFPTTLLQWWGRDRPSGRLPIELLVAKQTRMTAETVGLLDRGVIATGYRADLNIIDFETLGLDAPQIRHDLPAAGRRLFQTAHGYLHTFVAGTETRTHGTATGATPGHLVRGPKQRPS